jgi:hypothetical protein
MADVCAYAWHEYMHISATKTVRNEAIDRNEKE